RDGARAGAGRLASSHGWDRSRGLLRRHAAASARRMRGRDDECGRDGAGDRIARRQHLRGRRPRFPRHARRFARGSGWLLAHPPAVRRRHQRQRGTVHETSRADGAILRGVSDAEIVAASRRLTERRMIPGEAMSSRRAHPLAGVGAYTGRMRLRLILAPLCAASLLAQTPSSPIVERVGDTGFLQLHAESFNALDARQQALAYWLTQASIAIDPIIYDQLSQYGIREKRLLEEIVGRPSGIPQPTFDKIRQYALLFWANRGNHNENTSQKLLPAFAVEELQQAALTAQTDGAFK